MGPVLFLLYVNDIPSIMKSHLLLFADDIKLYRSIQSDNDIIQLQEDINNLLNRSNIWLLNFSIPKRKVLCIGSYTLPHNYNYTLNSILLDNIDDMRDLGIIIDNQLNFHLQTTQVVSKANRLLGVIKNLLSISLFTPFPCSSHPRICKPNLGAPLHTGPAGG